MAKRAPGNKTTLKDIAREAGVSITTVSLCLNGKASQYNISDATIARIGAVIERLNYRPNIHARAIASSKTFLVGVLSGGISRSFWADMLEGVETVLNDREYHMVLAACRYEKEKEIDALRFMEEKGVDGFLIQPLTRGTGKGNTVTYMRKLAERKPVVALNVNVEGIPSVYNDDNVGGIAAAEYLLANNHSRIAIIGASPEFSIRARGFADRYGRSG